MTLDRLLKEAKNVMETITNNFEWKDDYEMDPVFKLPSKFIADAKNENGFEKCLKRYYAYPSEIQTMIDNSISGSFIAV